VTTSQTNCEMRKFQSLRRVWLLHSLLLPGIFAQAQAVEGPLNVIVIVTDDQGYGDYGFMGNPHVRTPHLDRLAAASPQVDRFYVSPVCSPTRAALMTGRYAYRTGLIATNTGQSEMDARETTLAEVFRAAGYFTGIYGKWHLGDQYPRRAQDQGFEETLVHRGGGLGQPSEPPENQRRYTDPILFHNGEQVATEGYCTDVYFNYARAAMDRARHEERPFFIYIAPNAPHDPFHDVPPGPYGYYQSLGDELTNFPSAAGHFPIVDQGEKNAPDRLARIYAMEENIDTNVGALMAYLENHGLLERTLIVFFSDNGGLGRRYSAGLRGEKGEVYEGGIRSPLLMALPGRLSHATRIRVPTAHIDLFPTLLDACGLAVPGDLSLDGSNLWPMLSGVEPETALPARTLFLQSHVGNRPDLYRNIAVIRGDWKLVSNTHHLGQLPAGEPPFELFNLAQDPNENTNLIAQFPATAGLLALSYENWFYEATARRFGPQVIDLDAGTADTVVLTQQDRWFGQTPGWTRVEGDWRVRVHCAGEFRMQPLMRQASDNGPVQLWIPELAEQAFSIPNGGKQDSGLTLLLQPGVYTIRATAVLDGMTTPLHQLAIARADLVPAHQRSP
jgi:arylsulfatase A-like enzyme